MTSASPTESQERGAGIRCRPQVGHTLHHQKSKCPTPDRKVVEPNGFTTACAHEHPMRVAIIRSHPSWQWPGPRSNDWLNVRRRPRDWLKLQRRLARRGQLDIDRGQQLGVEQRAVLSLARAINAIARAQVVERVVSARMLTPRRHQRVNHALGSYRGLGREL
jgi:hypothetical protein